ncbi:MAG: PQQ-dependent sugar dehydrogenase [Gemmatimonadales bacterium]|nr:MAG: PQQ-dependent sugar dehydrogenase [Gemmatimonadales bacterium]
MIRSFSALSVALVVGLSACADADSSPSPADAASDDPQVFTSAQHDYRFVAVTGGLEHPWGLQFLPDGDLLVTERPGRLRVVRDGEVLEDPVAGLPEVRVGGQGGLLDVALHPDFEENHLVYLAYAKPGDDGETGTTAVIRGVFRDHELHDVEEVFEADAWSSGRGHHGSRIAFDADGYMFISVGDRQARPGEDLRAHPSQDNSNHVGVMIRLHDDGTVPEDNPFVDDADALPEIWSYGHRNPQGLAVHPETNEVWHSEHGPQGGDKLNRILPGRNYGWPVVGWGVNYGAGTPIHEAVRAEGMEDPVHHWTPSIATSGLMIYTGDRFPAWQGDIFVGGLRGQQLARVTLDDDHRVVNEETLVRDMGRIRDVRQGPDGNIWLVFDHGADHELHIARLEPAS